MKATASINIMSYGEGFDELKKTLGQFVAAGVAKDKLILGLSSASSTTQDLIASIGALVKDEHYGGLFLWGVGVNEGESNADSDIQCMKNSLGLTN